MPDEAGQDVEGRDKRASLDKKQPMSLSTLEKESPTQSHSHQGDAMLSEDDPRHPYRWRSSKKWTHVVLFSVIEFITPVASMMMAPAIPQIAMDLKHVSVTRATLAVSIYVLGFIVGPLVFGPLAQIYGRMSVYRTTMLLYLVMSVGCATATSIVWLTAFRFFGGCFGAAPIVIGGAAVADMYPPVVRGRPMAVYAVGPFLGLTLGPIFGGLTNYYLGWRWIFWCLSIIMGILLGCAFFILRETHLPTISRRLTTEIEHKWRVGHLWQDVKRAYIVLNRSRRGGTGHRLKTVLWPAFRLPVRIMFNDLPLFLLFVSNAVFTGIMNTLFTLLGATFQSRYNFTTRDSGLAYLGIGIGGVIAAVLLSNTSDKIVRVLAQRSGQGQQQRLERFRLPPIILGDLLASVGLIWYGWAVQSHSHWMICLAGTFVFGMGMLCIQAAFPTYLVHAYASEAGAALSASIITRSIGGSTIALSGPGLTRALGYGWAFTVLAVINLMFVLPAMILFLRPANRTVGKS